MEYWSLFELSVLCEEKSVSVAVQFLQGGETGSCHGGELIIVMI